MAKRILHAQYFADDKDIYDLLNAARQKLTPQRLVDHIRQRGLILSAEDDREALVDQIARLPFGWLELNALIEATDTADRAERVSSRALTGNVTLDDIQNATGALEDERSEVRGEFFKVEKFQKFLRVSVKYSELDTNKTRLVQRTQREFSLDFEETDDGRILVRHQDQGRAHEIIGALVATLRNGPEQLVDEIKVELGGIRDPAQRTDFFLKLIHGIDSFKLADVKAVKAAGFTNTPTILDPDDDSVPSDEPAVDSRPEGKDDEIPTDEAAFITQVKEIALRGQGILQSPHYKHLSQHNFFVRAIVWTAIDSAPGGPRVEFEAGFDHPEAGTGFTYAIRGIYAQKADGTFKKTKSSPDEAEKVKLLRLIERAARAALLAVVGSPPSLDDLGTAGSANGGAKQ